MDLRLFSVLAKTGVVLDEMYKTRARCQEYTCFRYTVHTSFAFSYCSESTESSIRTSSNGFACYFQLRDFGDTREQTRSTQRSTSEKPTV